MILTCFSGCQTKKNTTSSDSTSIISIEVESPKLVPQAVVAKVSSDTETLLPGIKKIIEKGTLNVAMVKEDLTVFCETAEDGTSTGLEIDIAKNIANSLGVELVINRECESHNQLAELLTKGSADLAISTYSVTTDRAAKVKLSNPYFSPRMGVMVNKQELVQNQIEKNPIDYMKNNTLKIAALKGTSHVQLVKEMFPNAIAVEMDSYKAMRDAVRNNEVFGYICGEISFLFDYYEDQTLPLHTQVFVFPDALDHYCIGVDPNNEDLLNFVNAYISSSRAMTIEDVDNSLKNKV